MAPKPAIFVFTTAYHPFAGGAEIAIQEVARRLNKDFRFFIFTARMRRDLPRRETRPEGAVIRIGFGLPWDKWLLPFMGAWAFFRERRATGIPLLWGMDVSAGALAAAFAKFLVPRSRFVLTIQYGYGGRRLRRGRLGAIGKAFRWMLRGADAVTAISRHLADEAVYFGCRRKVELLPNGVPLEKFKKMENGKSPRPPTVITVSRLVSKNGVDTLIRAVAEMRKSIPEILCHIVGAGPERPRLEALAQSLGVREAVTFFGSVPYEEVPRRLEAADVFIRPARSEGLGNAFLEALAAGLPVVGTPVEGILDIIEDGKTGFFARVEDPADVAEKAIRLLRDPALRRRMAEAGGAMVRERFSWDVIAAGYAEVFRRAMLPRILIATPQFPPDIGGPGRYAENLAQHLLNQGCSVSILSYGPPTNLMRFNLIKVSHGLPSGLKHFIYFLKAFWMLRRSDAALVFDPVIVGFSMALACCLAAKPMIIRLEGDFLWEWFSQRTGSEATLRGFYERFGEQKFSVKERLMHRLARWVFSQARHLVFSSEWRKNIFKLGYPLKKEQAIMVAPPWPRPQESISPVRGDASNGVSNEQEIRGKERILLFAGRFIRVKNLERLIRAFLTVAPSGWRLEIIGEGPEKKNLEFIIPRPRLGPASPAKRGESAEGGHNSGFRGRVAIRPPLAPEELRRRIASARAFLLPSLSEVSPNVIVDCLDAGTPFLLTRETGFYETLKDVGIFVNPLDEKDIAAKLRMLMDEEQYTACRKRLKAFRVVHSWNQVADEWLNLIAMLIR